MKKTGSATERKFQVKTCGALSKVWLEENGWQRVNDTGESVGSYYLKDSSVDIRYAHPVTFLPGERSARAIDRTTSELNFFAPTAQFAIPLEHIEARASTVSELEDDSNLRHMYLFDKDGHVGGVVLSDPVTLKSLNQTKFECVAIVNTTLTRVSWD
jgi:hypothetical protein